MVLLPAAVAGRGLTAPDARSPTPASETDEIEARDSALSCVYPAGERRSVQLAATLDRRSCGTGGSALVEQDSYLCRNQGAVSRVLEHGPDLPQ